MTTLMTQSSDVFTDTDPAIRFDRDDESWTISAGVLVASGRSAAVISSFDQSALFNNGTILSSSDNFAAVDLGNDSSITNAIGARIIGSRTGIVLIGDVVNVDNHGSILGLTGDGIQFDASSSGISITNLGAIDGRETGIRAFSRVDGGLIHNFGSITSAGDAIDIDSDDDLTTVITNAAGALIRGTDAAILVEGSAASRSTIAGPSPAGYSSAGMRRRTTSSPITAGSWGRLSLATATTSSTAPAAPRERSMARRATIGSSVAARPTTSSAVPAAID